MNLLNVMFKSLWKKKVISIFLIVQFLLCYYMIFKTYTTYRIMNSQVERVNKLLDVDKTYFIKIRKSIKDPFEDKSFDKFIEEARKIEGVEEIGSYTVANEGKSILGLKSFFINYDMTKIMKLKVAEGRNFDKDDFKDFDKGVPILIGKDLAEKHKLGDEFQTGGLKVKVIGILKENQRFFNRRYLDQALIDLDDKVVAPIYIDRINELNSYGSNFISINSKKQGEEIKGEIKKLSKDMNTAIEISSVKESVEKKYEEQYEKFRNYLRIDILIVIFAAFGLVVTLTMSMYTRKKEFGVRIAMGATKGYLYKMILGEMFILNLIGLILGLACEVRDSSFHIVYAMKQTPLQFFNYKIMLSNIAISLIVIFIFSLDVIRRLYKLEPRELIKGRD